MKILLTALLSLAPVVGAAGQFSAVQGKFDCPEVLNSLECARQIEARLGARVQRTAADALRVTLDDGHARVLAGDDAVYVALELLADRRLLVVYQQRPEGGGYGWLDLRSGAYRSLSGYPLFAPAGDLVVMAQQDVDAGYDPNVLEIHRYADRELTLVHKVDTPDWGPDAVRWTGERALRFRKVTMSCSLHGLETCPEFELERVPPR